MYINIKLVLKLLPGLMPSLSDWLKDWDFALKIAGRRL